MLFGGFGTITFETLPSLLSNRVELISTFGLEAIFESLYSVTVRLIGLLESDTICLLRRVF